MVPLRMTRSSTNPPWGRWRSDDRWSVGECHLGPRPAGQIVERGDDAAGEQAGERLLVEADRGGGAVGVAERDDELGATVVAGAHAGGLDDGAGRRCHVAATGST